MNKLVVEVRDVYGVTTMYPGNDTAKALCDIAGTATLPPRVLLTAVRRLGYDWEVGNAKHHEHVSKVLTRKERP